MTTRERSETTAASPGILAERGPGLRCRNWRAEALLRMLENVLEVGERPEDLIIYASLGKAVRDWPSYHTLVRALRKLEEDETLVIQSGRPVAVFQTTVDAPMVVSACNNLVGRWQSPERFYELAAAGKTMWGGLTAGAWQYIGAQGVLQGVYELFRAVGAEHFAGDLAGRWILTAGLGGMGSAQPLAATLAGAKSITVEVDPAKLAAVAKRGWLDVVVDSLDEALAALHGAADRAPLAVGLRGNAADIYPELVRRGVFPDVVTDLTAAHDARFGYVPPAMELSEWVEQREATPARVEAAARAGMAAQLRAMLAMRAGGATAFENGNNLRAQAFEAGVAEAFTLPALWSATCDRFFSAELVHLGGSCSAATGLISRSSMSWWSRLSLSVQRWRAGSSWPAAGFRSKACRLAAAGWAMASARGWRPR